MVRWRTSVVLVAALTLAACTNDDTTTGDVAPSATRAPGSAVAPAEDLPPDTTAAPDSTAAPDTTSPPAAPAGCTSADPPSGPPPSLPPMAVPDDLVPADDADPLAEMPPFDPPPGLPCEEWPGVAAWAANGIDDYDLLVDLRSREWANGGPVAGPDMGATAQATVVLSVRDGAVVAASQVDGDDLGDLLDPRRLTVQALLEGQGLRGGTPSLATWCSVTDPRGVPDRCVTIPRQGAFGSRQVTVLAFAER